MIEFIGTSKILKRYEFKETDDLVIRNSHTGFHNYKMTVNEPTIISNGRNTKTLFNTITRVLFRIMPSDKIMNLGINDYDSWNALIKKEIFKIKELWFNTFGKYPTYLYHNGIGINILLKLENRLVLSTFNNSEFNSIVQIKNILTTIIIITVS